MAPVITLLYSGEGPFLLNNILCLIKDATGVTALRYTQLPNNAGLKMTLETRDALTQFQSKKAVAKLQRAGLRVLDDPASVARKTLYVAYVQPCVWDNLAKDAAAIKASIEVKNKKSIQWAYVPPSGNWLKVCCRTIADADQFLSQGFYLDTIRVPARDIKIDEHIEVPQCVRCCSLAHSVRGCDKGRDTQICSRCGGQGHPWRTCLLPYKCVNCEGPHSAFSLSCRYKKDKQNEIRSSRRTRTPSRKGRGSSQGTKGSRPQGTKQNVSYANATKGRSNIDSAPPSANPGTSRAVSPQPGPSRARSPQPGPSGAQPNVGRPKSVDRGRSKSRRRHKRNNRGATQSPPPPPPSTTQASFNDRLVQVTLACAAYAHFRPDPVIFNQMLEANGIAPINFPASLTGQPSGQSEALLGLAPAHVQQPQPTSVSVPPTLPPPQPTPALNE